MKHRPGPSDSASIPRLAPELPLPPYSYVNGQFPHPIRDPAGHSFGVLPVPCPAPNPNRWVDCRPYLHGIDLFNHGYYWESHEVWESVWNAAGRRGAVADFIKGLIKLGAAGVKARERRLDGVRSHARRAVELFSSVQDRIGPEQSNFFGLSLPQLIELASDVARLPPKTRLPAGTPVEIIFPFILCPSEPL